MAAGRVTPTRPTAGARATGTAVMVRPASRGPEGPPGAASGALSDASLAAAIPGTLTAAALGAAYVAKGELVINVKNAPYNATGNGSTVAGDVTTETTAVQAALTAAAAAGAICYFPPGTYHVNPVSVTSGITIRGAGNRLSILQSASGDVLTMSGVFFTVENIHIKGRPGGGHAVVVPPGGVLSQSKFDMVQLTSQNDAKSCFKYTSVTSTGGGIFDVHWIDCYLLHTATSTVPAFSVYGDDNVFSANRFTRCRAQLCGTAPFFLIEADGAASQSNYNNVWDTINFESTNGGGIHLNSSMEAAIYNPGFFDMTTIVGDLIKIGRLTGSPVRPQSRGLVIVNYHRSGGTLSAVKDVNLVAGGNAGNTTIVGVGGPSGAGITIDLGAAVGYATVDGYDPSNVIIQNVTASTTLRTAQQGAILNVKHFGAKGDGTTDDTVAFQAAIDAAKTTAAITGAVVWVPFTPLGYAVGAFNLFAGVTLRGERRVKLKKIGTSGSTFISMYGPRSRMENVTVDTNGLATTRAIFITTGTTDIGISNCKITDTGAIANVRGVETTTGANDVDIRDCLFDGIDTPVFLQNTQARIAIRNNRLINWKTRGIYVLGTASTSVTDLIIEDNYITDMVTGAAIPRHPIQILGNVAQRHLRVRVSRNTVVGPNKSWTAADPGTADQISIYHCDTLTVNDNVSVYGGDVGITVSLTCKNVSVKGNVCMYNDTCGIYLGSDATGNMRDFTVVGNVCKNNGQNRNADRPAAFRCGIMVTAFASQGVVSGNSLGDDQGTKTQQYGVTCSSTTDVRLGPDADGGNAVSLYFMTGTNTNVTPFRGTVTSTSTLLAAIGNAINTTGKAAGDMVFNTTTSKPVWAAGATAGSVWVDATGATAHTPV